MLDATQKKQGYIRAMKTIDLLAAKHNISPEDAALKVIKDNRATIEQYVLDNNEVPEHDNRNLAAQAALIHEYKIWRTVQGGVPDYYTAESVVLADQQDKEDRGEVSTFGGAMYGSIFKAARAALPKINAKRIAAGKKPLLAGEKGKKLLQKVSDHVDVEIKSAPPSTGGKLKNTDIGIISGALSDQIEKEKVRDFIEKFAPLVVIILIAVFLAGKHFK